MEPCFPEAPNPSRRVRQPAANQLLTALHALAGERGVLLRHEERAWASITFAGSRHAFTWRFAGDEAVGAGENLIATLPEHEFSIPHCLVADATVAGVRHTRLPEPLLEVDCEILLLDED